MMMDLVVGTKNRQKWDTCYEQEDWLRLLREEQHDYEETK